jgi:tRNA nucleotidyltransferase/poly(A) polymerase
VKGLDAISGERVREELRSILIGPDPARGVKLLADLDLLPEVLPEVHALRGPKGALEPTKYASESGWTHTLRVLDRLKGSSYDEMMGGLLYRTGMPKTQVISVEGHIQNPDFDLESARIARTVMDRLKHGNNERDSVVNIVRLQGTIRSVQSLSKAERGRLFDRSDIMRLVNVHDADAITVAKDGQPSLSQQPYIFAEMDLLRNAEHPAHRLGADPVVTGKRLADWGYTPGPAVGKMVQAARTEQYGHGISTVESGRNFIDQHFSQFKGLSPNDQVKLLQEMGITERGTGAVH